MKEKFEEKVGRYFTIDDWPEYIITIDASNIMALVDATKFTKVQEWEPFNIVIPFDEGYVTYEDESFNVAYIKEIIKILKPDEYGIYKEYCEEKDDDGLILALKRGNYAIILAPLIRLEAKKTLPEIPLKSTLKKAPSSVMVL